MKKKIITAVEVLLILALFKLQIFPHWSVANATAGDFFCLEIIALLIYNIYDNLKQKI